MARKQKQIPRDKEKRYTLGIDWADKTSKVCVVDEKGIVKERHTIATSEEGFRNLFKRFKGAKAGIETSIFDEMVSNVAEECGVELFIADANKIRPFLASFHANKSDRKDADGIAELLRTSVKLFCPLVKRDTRYVRMGRLIQAREYFLKVMLSTTVKIRNISKAYGYRYDFLAGAEFGKKVRAFMRHAPRELSFIVTPITRLYDTAHAKELMMERRIYNVIRKDFAKEYRLLMTIPGVGWKTVSSFIAYLGDVNRFKDNRAVAAYFGLTPKVKQSGEKDKHFGITKRGNPIVRTHLVTAAKLIMCGKADTSLRRFGNRIRGEARTGLQTGRAICATARKLAVVMASMLRNGKEFSEIYGHDYEESRNQEREVMLRALEENKWVVTDAAKSLEVSRAVFRYRMKIYGIDKKGLDGKSEMRKGPKKEEDNPIITRDVKLQRNSRPPISESGGSGDSKSSER